MKDYAELYRKCGIDLPDTRLDSYRNAEEFAKRFKECSVLDNVPVHYSNGTLQANASFSIYKSNGLSEN